MLLQRRIKDDVCVRVCVLAHVCMYACARARACVCVCVYVACVCA